MDTTQSDIGPKMSEMTPEELAEAHARIKAAAKARPPQVISWPRDPLGVLSKEVMANAAAVAVGSADESPLMRWKRRLELAVAVDFIVKCRQANWERARAEDAAREAQTVTAGA